MKFHIFVVVLVVLVANEAFSARLDDSNARKGISKRMPRTEKALLNARKRRAMQNQKAAKVPQASADSAQDEDSDTDAATQDLPFGTCPEIYNPNRLVYGIVKCQPDAKFLGPSVVDETGQLFLRSNAVFNGGHVVANTVATVGEFSSIVGSGFIGQATVGQRNILAKGVRINNATTGNDIKIELNTLIYGNLGDNITIGKYSMVMRGARADSNTKIGDYSFLGEGSTLKDGFTIGSRSCVGKGVTVKGDVPDSTIVNKWGQFETVPRGKFVNFENGLCKVADSPPQ